MRLESVSELEFFPLLGENGRFALENRRGSIEDEKWDRKLSVKDGKKTIETRALASAISYNRRHGSKKQTE